MRPAARRPRSVTTGAPIHNASQAVVWPLQGKQSRATSTSS